MEESIIIGADLVPTESNLVFFEEGRIGEVFTDGLLEVLQEAKYRIFNLEAPLTESRAGILKDGPHLKISPRAMKGMKKLAPDLLTMANNHIMDYGEEGLNDTLQLLEREKISWIGCGQKKEEAAKAKIWEIAGKKAGIYACAQHEFSIADREKAGANPYDPIYSNEEIRRLKERCDYVIVLFHGGRELYRYPTRRTQELCRSMIQNGADLVICQHTHCIGCVENCKGGVQSYMDRVIFYPIIRRMNTGKPDYW